MSKLWESSNSSNARAKDDAHKNWSIQYNQKKNLTIYLIDDPVYLWKGFAFLMFTNFSVNL